MFSKFGIFFIGIGSILFRLGLRSKVFIIFIPLVLSYTPKLHADEDVFLDTFKSSGSTASTTSIQALNPLEIGKTYKVEVSGTFSAWGNPGVDCLTPDYRYPTETPPMYPSPGKSTFNARVDPLYVFSPVSNSPSFCKANFNLSGDPVYLANTNISFDNGNSFKALSFYLPSSSNPFNLSHTYSFMVEGNNFNPIIRFTETLNDNNGMMRFRFVVASYANAGVDRTVQSSEMLATLGDESSAGSQFQWTQISGTHVTILDPSIKMAQFEVPKVYDASYQDLIFQLTTKDAQGNHEKSDQVKIHINFVPTISSLSPDNASVCDTDIRHHVEASDPEGDILTYSWSIDGVPQIGGNADFALATTLSQGDHSISVTVSDDKGGRSSASTTVTILPNNEAPIASAALPNAMTGGFVEGSEVILDGTGSTDPENDALSYTWTSDDASILLTGANTATPSFRAPYLNVGGGLASQHFTFRLAVSDRPQSCGVSKTSSSTVVVQVNNVDIAPTITTLTGPGSFICADVNGYARASFFVNAMDPDADSLTYSWMVNSAIMETNESALVDQILTVGDGQTIAVTANDNFGGMAYAETHVDVKRFNSSPIVTADQVEVDEGQSATLLALGNDLDGDTITYTWEQIDGLPRVDDLVVDATTGVLNFTAPFLIDLHGSTSTILTFKVTATDHPQDLSCTGQKSTSAVVSVVIKNVNHAPTLLLSGSDSICADDSGIAVANLHIDTTDEDGDTLTNTWLIGDTPSSVTSDDLSLTLGVGGPYLVTAKTSDGFLSAMGTKNIIVKASNIAPFANIMGSSSVNEGAAVVLDGSASYDHDGDAISYHWDQISGIPVVLLSRSDASLQFYAPFLDQTSSELTFTLTVTDIPPEGQCGGIMSHSQDFTLKVENINHTPIANAGIAQTVNEGATVSLTGLASSDQDGDVLNYSWVQIEGTKVTLSGDTSSAPSFIAPQIAAHQTETLTFALTVDDGYINGLSSASQIAVTVKDVNAPPICSLARASNPVLWPPNHKFLLESISGISDPDDPVTIKITGVKQDEPVNGLGKKDKKRGADAIILGDKVQVRAERSGINPRDGRVYHIYFTADDGYGGTCDGDVTVGIPRSKKDTAIDSGALYDSTIATVKIDDNDKVRDYDDDEEDRDD